MNTRFIVLAFCLIPLSCKNRAYNGSETRAFRGIQPDGGPASVAELRLTGLEAKVPGLAPSDYRITKTPFVSPNRFAANKNVVNVEFPNLTRARCEAIRKSFGDVSKVICADGKFALQDFLHPAIQATLNQQFLEEVVSTPIDQFSSSNDALQTNCWATTFEVARSSSDSFYVFQMNGSEGKRILRDENWSTPVSGNDLSAASDAEVRAMLGRAEPGDMVLIHFNRDLAREGGRALGELMHAATVIDKGGLAFERTGWSGIFAMRFVTFDDILSQYPPGPQSYAWEIRRMKKAFPAPGEVVQDWSLGGEAKGRFSCARIPFSMQPSGKASLPPEAFQPIRGSRFMSADCIR